MEEDDDLDVLTALLDQDDDDEGEFLVNNDEQTSRKTNALHFTKPKVTKVSSLTESETKVDSGTSSDGSSSASTSSEEKLLQMAARIQQLEQQLKEQEDKTSDRSSLSPVQSQANVSFTPISQTDNAMSSRHLQNTPISNTKQETQSMSRTCKTPSGKNMAKERIAHLPRNTTLSVPSKASTSKCDSKPFKNSAQKRKADQLVAETSPSRAIPDHDDKDIEKDKFSGLRVIKPLISSVVMASRMEGRKMVPISHIETKMPKGKDMDSDWVTIGALVTKLPPKTSANGNTYGIWKLSDLGLTTANDTVAFFLFGEVYKHHWKTVEGSVVALLNPGILPAKEKHSQDVALTLDNPKKLMLMGISKDYGHCRANRHKDGKKCTNIINKEYGEFCEYHVNAAYKKMKSNRMEFQAGYGAPNKRPLMNKLQKDMSSSTFMYQGKTLCINGPTPQKMKVSLRSLGITDNSMQELTGMKEKPKNVKANDSSSDVFLDLLTLPSIGTRNLVKHLHKDEEEKKPKEERVAPPSASQLLKTHKKELEVAKRSAGSCASTGASRVPMLGRGLAPGADIMFEGSLQRPVASRSRSKLIALSVVRGKGPIEKDDPNAVRKNRWSSTQEEVEKRVEKDQRDEEASSCEKNTKRRRILGPQFGNIDLNSKEGKRLVAAKSLHAGQVAIAQEEIQEKYFNELERKELSEEKMKAIKEILVKVVCCKKCVYVAESASDICYKENHPLKHTKMAKRFFACKACQQRTISYGSRMPKYSCKNCGAMNYEKASMYQERKGPKIAGETLLLRGEEHGKYLNSLK